MNQAFNDPPIVPNADSTRTPGMDDEGEPIRAYMTWALVAAWVGVYVAMMIVQGRFDTRFGKLGPGVIDTRVAHEFGAMIPNDVIRGEVWRTITATFIHFSLLHLIFNLTALISIGRVLESWYGATQFLLVYLVIGAAGNGLAVAGRYTLGGRLDVPCAGGSSVMFGLIALIAVVGWRSRTRFGDYVRRQMVGKLILFGVVIGVVGRNTLDNYGHAGGAIAGAAVGFTHRYLIRLWDRRSVIIAAGLASSLILIACVSAQWRVGHREFMARKVEDRIKRERLTQLMAGGVKRVVDNYNLMAQIIEKARGPFLKDPTARPRVEIVAGLLEIGQTAEIGVPGGDAARYSRWRQLALLGANRQPPASEISEFRALSRWLVRDVAKQLREAIRPKEKQVAR